MDQRVLYSSHSNTIASFEGGRGLAALFVALFHFGYGANVFAPVRNGYLFVDLFFVISGFVICAGYSARLNNAASFRAFLIRRFGRLFPLLVFSTLLYVGIKNLLIWAKQTAVALGYGGKFEKTEFTGYLVPDFAEVVSTLTFTHGMGIFDRLILNPVSWSISTEFYAYVLFAGVCLVLRGRARLVFFALLSVVGLLATVWATVYLHDCFDSGKCLDVSYDFGFARCVGSFFLGALVYHASRTARFHARALQFAAIAGLGALFFLAEVLPALVFASPLLFALLVFSLSRDTGFAAAVLKTRPLQVLGQRSYSVYMLHPILMMCMEPLARRAHGVALTAVTVAVYIAVLVLVSGWTYRFVEDPLRRMFNRLAGDQRRPQLALKSSLP